MRSALKQRVGAVLAKNGIARPYSNLFGPGGSRFLAELELREGPRRRLDSLLALIAAFDGEIGDISRCPSARHLCAWAGLTPTVRSSDGKARLGHISGQGSPALRWALVEAAQHAPTGGGPLRAAYERIAKRRGKQVAKVAVARKILTLCYYGLRDGEIRCLAPRAKARTIRTTAVTR